MSGARGAAGALSAAEQCALDALDFDALVQSLQRLIGVPSLDGVESEAQRAVAGWMTDAGVETDVWPIDLEELARHPLFGAEVERTEALGVVGWTGAPAGGRDLMLNGHIDVVPPGDAGAWTTPPWEPVVRLGGRLAVASVVGEEDGGTGTLATLLRDHSADAAVVVEPTQLRVVPAQAGSLMFRLTVFGSSARGCVREQGVSAVEKFVLLFATLRDLEAERCGVARGYSAVAGDSRGGLFAAYRLPWPIEVGTMRAGDWASSVPDTLVAEGRYGVAIGEDPVEARRAFEEAITRAASADPWLQEHPPTVEWWGGRFDPALTDLADPIVATVVGAATAVTGSPPLVEGVTYGADMRLLVNVGGIPTVLFGPGEVRVAHMPDAYLPIDQLHAAAEALVLTALRFCGVEE